MTPTLTFLVFSVAGLVDAVNPLHTEGPQLGPAVAIYSLSHVTTFSRVDREGPFKRWFKSVVAKITRMFHPWKLEEEALKWQVLRLYATFHRRLHLRAVECIAFPDSQSFRNEDYGLCRNFPLDAQNLCRYLADWVKNQLMKVKKNCQAGLTAAECIAAFKIPLIHPLITTPGSDAAASSPYVIREFRLSPELQEDLRQLDDTLDDTRKFFNKIISRGSSIQLLSKEKLNERIRTTKDKTKWPRTKRNLLHSLRHYYLNVLAEAPTVDPLVLRLLLSMTTKNCSSAGKRKMKLLYNGQKIVINGYEAMSMFWGDLVKAAIDIDKEGCLEKSEDNCALIKMYLQHQAHLLPRLKGEATQDNFINRALDVMNQNQRDEHLEAKVDRRTLTSLAKECRQAAAADLLYGLHASRVKFGKVVNFLGRRKWSRAVLAALVRRTVFQLMEHHTKDRYFSQRIIQRASPENADEAYGLALYYAWKNGAKTWALTGNEGLGHLVGHIILRETCRLWETMPPQSLSTDAAPLPAARSLLHLSLHPVHFFPSHAIPQGHSKALLVRGDQQRFNLANPGTRKLALVQGKWSSTVQKSHLAIFGILIMIVAASALPLSTISSIVFPVLFLFAGICMFLISIASAFHDDTQGS